MVPSRLLSTPSCADNHSSPAAGATSSLYENDNAFLEASLDATDIPASPDPVKAAGHCQSPHQAEQQPPVSYGPPQQHQHQQQQDVSEQAKGVAMPDDSCDFLLHISDSPFSRLRVRGGVACTRGRGDDAGGIGADEFASTCMSPTAVIGDPIESTMMELNFLADAVGHLEGVDVNMLATHATCGSGHSLYAFPLDRAEGERQPSPYSYHPEHQHKYKQTQHRADSYSFSPRPHHGQQERQQQKHYLSDASHYMAHTNQVSSVEINSERQGLDSYHHQHHQHHQQHHQQPYYQRDASTSIANSIEKTILPSFSSHPHPLKPHCQHHQHHLHERSCTLKADVNPAPITSPCCLYRHGNTTDSLHPHINSSCNINAAGCITNRASVLYDDKGEEEVAIGSCSSTCSTCSGSSSINGSEEELRLLTTENYETHFASSAGAEAYIGSSGGISSPSLTTSEEDDEELPHHHSLPATSRIRRNAAIVAAAALAADSGSRSRRRSVHVEGYSSTRSSITGDSSSSSTATFILPFHPTTTASSGGIGGGYWPPLKTVNRHSRRKYSMDPASFVIVPTPKILLGSWFDKRPNRLCRTPGCRNRYRTPGYLCESCGGGKCQVKGCRRLHQGKQGLSDLFFCRAHRNVYAALMMKDGGGCAVEEQEREKEQEQEQELELELGREMTA
ncbi:hypothetical protein VYU27_005004 [Nannochloropsis oceanica]